jgi:putative transposase
VQLPRKLVIDTNDANTSDIKATNKLLKGLGCPTPIEVARQKRFNNIVEHDHRFI